MRKPLVVLWRWFGAPSATLVGDGGSTAAGNAGELALGGSEAGIWVCGFGMRARHALQRGPPRRSRACAAAGAPACEVQAPRCTTG